MIKPDGVSLVPLACSELAVGGALETEFGLLARVLWCLGSSMDAFEEEGDDNTEDSVVFDRV